MNTSNKSIEDKLNVAEELEADIASPLKNTSVNGKPPSKTLKRQKRSQHYINSKEMDTSLSFIKEREQRFPKAKFELFC
ncbi:hypothetical protein O9992_26935 [Vibrio lentus]|nr:hypothetical protein [Vibrio lentus]